MHEVGLAEELIAACIDEAGGARIDRVVVRHASTVSEDALRQAFTMLAADGPLAGARLETTRFELRLECACGFAGALGPEHEIGGSVIVCPACGDVRPAPRTPEIELLGVERAVTAS
ncbi:MAG TPA: hydrogenase maturation nickel metallochaperone HypA [Candidatus Limnocylindrales bacterium]|jgi:Zn finger protein HypA/HybF involved in hydrogenase expression